MKTETHTSSRFSITSAIFDVLDPIPFGFFVGALIFDILYSNTYTVLWVKAAAWLISIGLVFASPELRQEASPTLDALRALKA